MRVVMKVERLLAVPAPWAPAVPRSRRPCYRQSVAANAKGKKVNGFNHDSEWDVPPLPGYMQQGLDMDEFCQTLDEVLREGADTVTDDEEPQDHNIAVWNAIRREAEADAATEPLLSSFLYASILSHDTFERSLAFVLANRLSDATLLSTELFEVFHSILRSHKHVSAAALADICAVRERDPSCRSYSQALLYFKGFHSIQVHRIAHELWCSGRKVMALALQSRMSEVFAVDIHPAARLGKGVLLDHGTGVVIGETAVVGNNVSILQNVTLGGTGKEHGDRHPKIGNNVLIGASATILGNIQINEGAQVAAGSLVLKPVPPHTMVAGSPAKEVGFVTGNPAFKMEQWVKESQEQQHSQEPPPAAASSSGGGTGGSTGSGSGAKPQAAAPSSSKAAAKQHQPAAAHHHKQRQPAGAGAAAASSAKGGEAAKAGKAPGSSGSGKPKVDPEYFI